MTTFYDVAAAAGLDLPKKLYQYIEALTRLQISDISSSDIEKCLISLYDKFRVRGAEFAKCRDYIFAVFEYAKAYGHIDDIPKIEPRWTPHENTFNKPDEANLKLLLSHSKGLPIETIVRLSWECGLSRAEISNLKYNQIDFGKAEIVLPDRRVPLTAEMADFLVELKEKNEAYSDYVLLSQRKSAPMAEQSISRLVRTELNKYKMPDVRYYDLCFDYVVRQLQTKSVQDVSFITGIDVRTLKAQYLPYVEVLAEGNKKPRPSYDDFYRLMIDEGTSICGLALWFAWQVGISPSELNTLTWDMVDFENSKIKDKDIPGGLIISLRKLKMENDQYSDYIFLGNKSKKPLAREYISRVVRNTLIHNGYYNVGLNELRMNYSPALQGKRRELTELLLNVGCANCKEIATALGMDAQTIGSLLRKLKSYGDIVQIGTEYYLYGTVVPPEEQHAAIITYVSEHPNCSRREICDVLGLVKQRQFVPIVKPLIDAGVIIRTPGQRYCMPDTDSAQVIA